MRANRWRVYLNPFDDLGNYSGYVDVSDDVELDQLGSIDQMLDNADYNIGIYRNANFAITFRNDSGKYSDVGQPNSIFKYTRANSLVKITWAGCDSPLVAGFMQSSGPSVIVAPEVDVFIGLLSDKDLTLDLQNQELQFNVLGRETVLSRSEIPRGSLFVWQGLPITAITIASPGVFSVAAFAHGLTVGKPIQFFGTGAFSLPNEIVAYQTYYVSSVPTPFTFTLASSRTDALNGSSINTTGAFSGTVYFIQMYGMLISDVINAMVLQSSVTKVLTYDPTRINVGTDMILDDTTDMQNLSVWDALQDLLLLSNSVLYIQNDTLVVAPRTPTALLQYTFYGQSSQNGVENIQNIQGIQAGLSRVFNSLFWTPSNTLVQDSSSIAKYGLTAKEFNQTYINDVTNQATILAAILAEFGQPKQEMDIYTPMSYQSLLLFLLHKIAIDYPPSYIPGPNPFPICGAAICGAAILPKANWGFTEIPSNFYKIEGTSIDPQTNLICFSVRRV